MRLSCSDTTTSATDCTVTGLTNGSAYTFTVTAANSLGSGPAAYSSSVIPVSNYSVNPLNLAVSGLGGGVSRTITITNLTQQQVTINGRTTTPTLPGSAEIDQSSTCSVGHNLAANASCTLIINPGSDPTSSCVSGEPAVPSVITVGFEGGSSVEANVFFLAYGCQYQGGYLFSIDDKTPTTNSIGGVVAAVLDSVSIQQWSNDGVNFSIWGIDETSTPVIPSPNTNTLLYPSVLHVGQLNCDGKSDGACDTNNIVNDPSYPDGGYAAAKCKQAIDSNGNTPCLSGATCYTDWYMPAICQLGNNISFCPYPPDPNNIETQLHNNNIGGFDNTYWSATEVSPYGSMYGPSTFVYIWNSINNEGELPQKNGNGSYSIRCVRSLTF